MTFKMFNWINDRLKAQHVLEFRMNISRKYFTAPLDRRAMTKDIDLDTDIIQFSIYIKQEIDGYRPGYYNFYLLDKTTEEKFVVYDADKYNEENENGD